MKVNQELSILFWLWKAKQTTDGAIPIYVRVTINGLRDQFSSGKKIMAEHWNEETGFAIRACKDAGTINTYITYTTAEKEPNYEILDIKDLGSNAAILNYLESRGVGQVAEGRLKEIYYYIEDEAKKRNKFFAAGWQNEKGAWEIRNLNFKGCLGHKAVSFIPNSEKKLVVFEGFFNYLSWLTENPFAPDSVLVLNSLSLLQAGILKAQDFRDIALYLDNDTSGRQATLDFTSALPWAKDRAGIYTGYNDYNDLIVAGLTNYQLNR
jgi:hypothetical protein